MEHIENIRRVHGMLGLKTVNKVKVGLIVALTSILGFSGLFLADDVAFAFHAIQQRNIRAEMVEIGQTANDHREAIKELKVQYAELEARLDDQLDDQLVIGEAVAK